MIAETWAKDRLAKKHNPTIHSDESHNWYLNIQIGLIEKMIK